MSRRGFRGIKVHISEVRLQFKSDLLYHNRKIERYLQLDYWLLCLRYSLDCSN